MIELNNTPQGGLPRQKLSKNRKTEKWRKECVEAGIRLITLDATSRRSSRQDKIRNYSLYNGHFDKADMETELQPLKTENLSFPANIQYRDIASPIFNLLFGEESKRGLNFIIRAINEDAISEKETFMKDTMLSFLYQSLSQEQTEGQEQQTPEQVQKYFTYEYQDVRETLASNILNYLKRQLNIESIFQKGWEDALLAGEELYEVAEVSGEPIAKRLNPVNVYYYLTPDSDIIDDADIIAIEEYLPIGKVIDNFYEDLTPKQVDDIEGLKGDKLPFEQQFFRLPEKDYVKIEDELPKSTRSGYLDESGNIRVIKVIWKSRQKIGFLTYLDENGEQQETIVSEEFKEQKDNPDEQVIWKWRNQYWEGTKIGQDIYINMRPKTQQFRRMDNLSACSSGIIGTVYNANNSRATSLMDRLIPWIYLYVTIWYRTELLIAANQGKIALIDLALIPKGWEVDKWLYYASIMKFGFVDSFNEGNQGQATGKLAGNISTTQNKSLDLETGTAIQGHISLLEYVEDKLHELSGVTKQRKGAIAEREAVGNVERTIVQSSHITEKWFQVHNWTKQRVLEGLIEVAKDTWSGDTKKLQYVSDDMSTVFFSIDGNEFINSEFGVFVTNASKDQEALQALKQLTQAALQNDKISFSNVIDLYLNESLSGIKNKLRAAEVERNQEIQAQQTQQLKSNENVTQAQIEARERELDREDTNQELDRRNKIDVALIQAHSRKGSEEEGEPIKDRGDEKMSLEREKIKNKQNIEEQKLRILRDKQKEDSRLKEKQIALNSKNKAKKTKR